MSLKSILIKPKQNASLGDRIECPQSQCKEKFSMASAYLSHMATHKHFLLSCNICNKGFYDQKFLDEHYLTHPEVINTYDCDKCPRKFLQKYQLEQHWQFHSVAYKEPAVRKRKSVQFNNVLESRCIEDFQDSDQNESSSDEDYLKDYNPVNKINSTRSGRVVKHKKFFDDAPEMKKRKYRKSNKSHVNTSVTAEKDNGHAKPIVTENVVVKPLVQNKDVQPIIQNKAVQPTSDKVVQPAIPNEVESTVAQNKTVQPIIQNEAIEPVIPNKAIQPTIPNKAVELMTQNKAVQPVIQNKAVQPAIQNKAVQPAIQNKAVQPAIQDKTLQPAIQDKTLQPAIQNKAVQPVTPNRVAEPAIQNKAVQPVNPNRVAEPVTNNMQPAKLIDKELRVVVDKIPASLLKKYTSRDIKINSNNSTEKPQNKSDKLNVSSSLVNSKLPTKSIGQSSIASANTIQRPTINLPHASNSVRPRNQFVPPRNEQSPVILPSGGIDMFSSPSTPTLTDVTKGFLYVGPNPNIGQIKRVIDEVKAMKSNTFAPVTDTNTVNSTNVSPSAQVNTNLLPVPVSTSPTNNLSPVSSKDLNGNQSTELNEEGILEKTTIQNILVVKVTPEYMEKIQKQRSDAIKVGSLDLGKKTDSCVSPPASKNENSKIILNEEVEQNSDSASMPPNIPLSSDVGAVESPKVLSKEEKLLLRCQAKIEEKERKKKEKYEFKKKMRYMEKLFFKEIKPSTCGEAKKSYSKEKSSSPSKYSANEKTSENVQAKQEICKSKCSNRISKKKIDDIEAISLQKYNSKDPFSDISIITSNTFTMECPCNSKDCTDSSHMNSTSPCSSSISKKSSSHESEAVRSAEEAINKVRGISQKFNKSLSEKEHIKLLKEIEKLIANFNIKDKCDFLFPIIRFCRLYVDSHKVKEQAMSLSKKLTKPVKVK